MVLCYIVNCITGEQHLYLHTTLLHERWYQSPVVPNILVKQILSQGFELELIFKSWVKRSYLLQRRAIKPKGGHDYVEMTWKIAVRKYKVTPCTVVEKKFWDTLCICDVLYWRIGLKSPRAVYSSAVADIDPHHARALVLPPRIAFAFSECFVFLLLLSHRNTTKSFRICWWASDAAETFWNKTKKKKSCSM